MVSHSMPTLREYCNCGLVLHGGKAAFFEDIEEAIGVYNRSLASAA